MKTKKRFWHSNIFLLALSFLAALAIWFYCNGIYNPEGTQTFTKIPIEITLDGSTPQRNNLTLASAPEEQLVDIEVTGPRLEVSMLRKNNISATVDLRTIDKAGVYTLDVEIDFGTNNGIQIIYQSVTSVTLTFDEVEEKSVDVTVQTMGELPEGYRLGSALEANPASITVTGPKSVLENISDTLVYEVNLDKRTSTATETMDLVLYDNEGNTVSNPYVTTNVTAVDIVVPVYVEKEVPLTVTYKNTMGGSDLGIVKADIQPASIIIYGPEDLIADINQITLDSVDTSSIEYSKTQKYELPNILSNRIWSDTTSVSVTYSFENHVSRTFNVTRVSVINVPENVSYKLNTEEFTIRVRGLAAEMDKLSASDIVATVDLSNVNVTTGVVSVPVTFSLPTNVNAGVYGTRQEAAGELSAK